MQHVINAWRSTWRAARTLYHTAAFLALAFVVWSIYQGHTSGYASTILPFGTAINQVDAAQFTANAAKPEKPVKQAAASPLPAEKPPVPPTPAQVP